MMRFVLLGMILTMFHLVTSFLSVNDWLMSRRKRSLMASSTFLIIE